jgi:hypothetical protein
VSGVGEILGAAVELAAVAAALGWVAIGLAAWLGVLDMGED